MARINLIKIGRETYVIYRYPPAGRPIQFNSFHRIILFWGITILALDGYDLAIVGAAVPALMKEMGVDATKAGFMASSALFGMMVGAISLGILADKFGRKPMIAVCITLFSVFTAGAGLASDPLTFSILRFIAGLGIGGVLPVITAQMAEFAPSRQRARLVTIVFSGYSLGGVLVATVGKQLIENWGWQSVFFTAIAPLALIPFILKTMPESMPFLIRTGRIDELRSVITPSFAPDPGHDIPAAVEAMRQFWMPIRLPRGRSPPRTCAERRVSSCR